MNTSYEVYVRGVVMDDLIKRMYDSCRSKNADFGVFERYVDDLDLESVRALACCGLAYMTSHYKCVLSLLSHSLYKFMRKSSAPADDK